MTETNNIALTEMVWADDPANDDKTRCTCCDKPIKGEPKYWVEVTADMNDAVSPDLGLDPSDSGGWFPVGPECARKHLRGFAVKAESSHD